MIVETSITIRKGLADNRFGVNFQLNSLPLFDEHKRPRQVAAIWDPFTNEGMWQGNLGTARPLILVSQPRPYIIEGEVRADVTSTDPSGMELAVAYVTEAARQKSPGALLEVGYTLRAMQRVIWEFFKPDYAESDRVVNNIQVRDCLEMTVTPADSPFEGVEDVRVAGLMFLRLGIRDVEPT